MREVRIVAARYGKTVQEAIQEGLGLWLAENRAPRLPAPSRAPPLLDGPGRPAPADDLPAREGASDATPPLAGPRGALTHGDPA